jgi:hypothetical protein
MGIIAERIGGTVDNSVRPKLEWAGALGLEKHFKEN